MKVLITSMGSRGDVQPALALAMHLRTQGHEVRICATPNFRSWVSAFGFDCVPMGPDLRQLTGRIDMKHPPKPSPEQVRRLAVHAVRSQFPAHIEAARGCDLIVATGGLQVTGRSVAELLGVPYLFAAYCPASLPSPDHPPARIGTHHSQSLQAAENIGLWVEEEQEWNSMYRDALNAERARHGLAPVENVRRHIVGHEPWLAADAVLGPAGANPDLQVTQTGAWLLDEQGLLPDEVERFLDRGEPPVYFGFGSMRVADGCGRVLTAAARALGLRSIVSRGWGNLCPGDDDTDCLVVGDLPHAALFGRVAAVVHHGGAGTTLTAARAGKAQVIVPHLYDQYYWAHRVQRLGIGVSAPSAGNLTVEAIASALGQCMQPEVQHRARMIARRIELQGARRAAAKLIEACARIAPCNRATR